MSSLIPFSFESHEVRFIPEGDSFSVVVKDVLLTLEYAEASNPARVIAHVPEEWKGVNPIHTPGGIQEMLTLTEQGFYFFVNRSDKPKALPLQKWVAGEVLPSIRKTGSYALPGAQPPNAHLAAQLSELLQGKVLVDVETIGQLTRLVHAMEAFLPRIGPLAQDLEHQCGRTLVNHLESTTVAPPASSHIGRPPSLMAQRRFDPTDPWISAVQASIADRQEVTLTGLLDQLGHKPNQLNKNRLSKLLQGLGWRLHVTSVHGTGCRVYRRG
ncbi:MAG: hypothetical protein H6974_09545 [Gammaproteobacteria bacterium]|nr:hypothetical protein [Gammaproteobacteria bacterium]